MALAGEAVPFQNISNRRGGWICFLDEMNERLELAQDADGLSPKQ